MSRIPVLRSSLRSFCNYRWKVSDGSIRGSLNEHEFECGNLIEHGKHHKLVSDLRRCTAERALADGRCLHDYVIKEGLAQDRFLGNLLVQMYGKCGALDDARKVFNSILCPNLFTWNLMIGAYIQHGYLDEAKELYRQMPQYDVVVASTALITGYSQNGRLKEAFEVFEEMPERNVVSWTAMVRAYAQHGKLNEAVELFKRMPLRDVTAWNTMITAYAQQGCLKDAIQLFQQMPERNVVSWTAIITACAEHGYLKEAFQFFEKMPDRSIVTWNAMLAACIKQGNVHKAYEIFQRMPIRTMVSWTSMIAGFAQQGQIGNAVELFKQMPEHDLSSYNVMITVYGQNGHLQEAFQLFQSMPQRDIVSWNAMLGSYAKQGKLDHVLHLFKKMQLAELEPDKVTLIVLLDACAIRAALTEGINIHMKVRERGFVDPVIHNALINMYSKCGNIKNAQDVFDKMPCKDLLSWSAIIAGYAHHGLGDRALNIFQQMQRETVALEQVIFVSILAACSYASLLTEGYHYFVSMGKDYSVTLKVEHCNCMIDLFGHVGWLDEATSLINNLIFSADITSWTTLLGCCRNYADLKWGKYTADHFLELYPENDAPYVLLSNIYAAD